MAGGRSGQIVALSLIYHSVDQDSGHKHIDRHRRGAIIRHIKATRRPGRGARESVKYRRKARTLEENRVANILYFIDTRWWGRTGRLLCRAGVEKTDNRMAVRMLVLFWDGIGHLFDMS